MDTANKLGVNVYQYFRDRIAQTNLLPSLASLIQERSATAHQSVLPCSIECFLKEGDDTLDVFASVLYDAVDMRHAR